MPCLAATYADLKGEATRAWAEAMLMMRPQPFSFMAGTARRIAWNAPDRLMARMASHFSTGNSSIGATCWMPALLTMISMPPNVSAVWRTMWAIALGLLMSAGE